LTSFRIPAFNPSVYPARHYDDYKYFVPTSFPKRLYLDRTAGGDCDYRHFGRHALASAQQGKDESQGYLMSEQSETDATVLDHVCHRSRWQTGAQSSRNERFVDWWKCFLFPWMDQPSGHHAGCPLPVQLLGGDLSLPFRCGLQARISFGYPSQEFLHEWSHEWKR